MKHRILTCFVIVVMLCTLSPRKTKVEKKKVPISADFEQKKVISGVSVVLADNMKTEAPTEVVETPQEAVAEPEPTYSEEDLRLLSRVIMGEAGHCDRNMKLYVGSVVVNRVNSPYFPDTYNDVIYQNGQYSVTWHKNSYFYQEPNAECVEVATFLLTNGSVLPYNVLYQANFKQGNGVYLHYQNMYFCYGKD